MAEFNPDDFIATYGSKGATSASVASGDFNPEAFIAANTAPGMPALTPDAQAMLTPTDRNWLERRKFKDRYHHDPSEPELAQFIQDEYKNYVTLYEKEHPEVRRRGETSFAYQLRQEPGYMKPVIGAGYVANRRKQGITGTLFGEFLTPEQRVEQKQAWNALQADPLSWSGALAADLGAEAATGILLNRTPLGRMASAPGVKGYAGTGLFGMTQGAISGAQTPASDRYENLYNIGTSTALGGLIPVGLRAAWQTGGKAADYLRTLFSKSGLETAQGRALNTAAGAENVPSTIAALRKPVPANAPTVAPYTRPTTVQALVQSGDTNLGIPGLAWQVKNVNPTPFSSVSAAQAANREGMLGQFAGQPSQIAAAESVRAADTAAANRAVGETATKLRLGREAKGEWVDTMGMTRKGVPTSGSGIVTVPTTVPEMEALKQSKSFQAAIADARRAAANLKGVPGSGLTPAQIDDIIADPTKSLEGLKLIKSSIDDAFNPNSPGATSLKRVGDRSLAKLKESFLDVAEKVAPGWQAARQQYANASSDIFQQRAGAAMLAKLQDKLIPGAEKPRAFINALEQEKSLIKAGGGLSRQELSDQLYPANQALVDRTTGQLGIDAKVKQLMRQGATDERVKQALGAGNFKIPETMQQDVTVAKSVWQNVMGKGKTMTMQALADTLQDPVLTARLMENASLSERAALSRLARISKLGAVGTATGVQEVRR